MSSQRTPIYLDIYPDSLANENLAKSIVCRGMGQCSSREFDANLTLLPEIQLLVSGSSNSTAARALRTIRPRRRSL